MKFSGFLELQVPTRNIFPTKQQQNRKYVVDWNIRAANLLHIAQSDVYKVF
jgi:hypothetical protein